MFEMNPRETVIARSKRSKVAVVCENCRLAVSMGKRQHEDRHVLRLNTGERGNELCMDVRASLSEQ